MFTSRTDNVGHHRAIQARVAAAVSQALRLARRMSRPPGAAAAGPALLSRPGLPSLSVQVQAAEAHAFSLPLAALLTTTGGGGSTRDGLLLRLRWRSGASSGVVSSEIAPLPGAQMPPTHSRADGLRRCGSSPPLS